MIKDSYTLNAELQDSLNKFCSQYPDIEIDSAKASKKGNLILRFEGFDGLCVIDSLCQVIAMQAKVPPVIQKKGVIKPEYRRTSCLISKEESEKQEIIQQKLNSEKSIQRLPFAEDIQSIEIYTRKNGSIGALVIYKEDGNIEDASHNAFVAVPNNGTANTISRALLTKLKKGVYLKNVGISEKKKAELAQWAETVLGKASNAALSFYEKYGSQKQIPAIPMLYDVFFDRLTPFVKSKKKERPVIKYCSYTEKWDINYQGISAEYDLCKDKYTFRYPKEIAEEAVFWNEHFEEMQDFSYKLQEVIDPDFPVSFFPVIPSEKFMTHVKIRLAYVDDIDIIVDMSKQKTVATALRQIKKACQKDKKFGAWFNKTKKTVLQITGGQYQDKWTYLQSSGESPFEPTLTLTIEIEDHHNMYDFHPSQSSKEVKDILAKIRSDCTANTPKQKTFAGNVLYRAIYMIIDANSSYITENNVIKLLRGKAFSSEYVYKITEFTGKFGNLHEDVVKASIEDMIKKQIINQRIVDGQYAKYYALYPNKESAYIFEYEYAPHTSKTKVENYTDDDWMKTLHAEAPPADKVNKWMNLTHILDHHGLVCFAMDEIATFLAKGPETILTYIEARKTISSTLVERRMYTVLLKKIQEERNKSVKCRSQ